MPGKMTVLDRLISEGRIKKSPFGNAKYAVDELSFPSIREMDGKLVGGTARNMTPERVKYQRGIEARLYPKKIAADELLDEANTNRETIQDEWNDAIADAKESMKDDWESTLDYQAFEDVDPNYLEVDAPSTDLREYWPGYARSPEEIGEEFDAATDAYWDAKEAQRRIYSTRGIMDEQVQTPRYRNYQRAMQQRAANMAMGRDLSRRYAIAYNNLLRRGLTPAEARMYMREYFGGR